MVGGSFNRRGSLHTRPTLDGSKTDGSPQCPPPHLKILHLHITGFSHVHCGGVFKTTSLSQHFVVGAASERKKGRRNAHFKDEEGVEEPLTPDLQLTDQLAVMSFW